MSAMEEAINLDVDAGNGGNVSEKSYAARYICVRKTGASRDDGSSGSPEPLRETALEKMSGNSGLRAYTGHDREAIMEIPAKTGWD